VEVGAHRTRLPLAADDLILALDFLRKRVKTFHFYSADDIPRLPDDDWCYRYQFVSEAAAQD
jgi:hypothetical protein